MAHQNQLKEDVTVLNVGRYTREAIFALADRHGVQIYKPTRNHLSLQHFPHLTFEDNQICSADNDVCKDYSVTIEEFCARIAGEWVAPNESPIEKELRELKQRVAELQSQLNQNK